MNSQSFDWRQELRGAWISVLPLSFSRVHFGFPVVSAANVDDAFLPTILKLRRLRSSMDLKCRHKTQEEESSHHRASTMSLGHRPCIMARALCPKDFIPLPSRWGLCLSNIAVYSWYVGNVRKESALPHVATSLSLGHRRCAIVRDLCLSGIDIAPWCAGSCLLDMPAV